MDWSMIWNRSGTVVVRICYGFVRIEYGCYGFGMDSAWIGYGLARRCDKVTLQPHPLRMVFGELANT